MIFSLRSRSGYLLAAALFGLAAAPREASAQAQPDEPDQVQILSEQSYQESLGEPTAAAAPSLLAGATQSSGVRRTMAAAGSGYRCLPSCSVIDGRFLAVAGANLVTLSGREMSLLISVPAGVSSFQLGVFDGDVRATDGAGVSHWDIGVASLYEYTLYADPFGDGTGTTVVEMQPGSPVIASTSMPDNAWIDFTVATGPAAQSPSGNYFYRLSINLTAPTLTTLNAFKIRATAVVSGVTLDPETEPFSYIASFTSVGDAQTLYPSYPTSNIPSNYNGVFDFYFDLPVARTEVAVWDGDFDHGKFDGSVRDTDDPDTPGSPFRPFWATIDTLSEGVAVGVLPSTGNPPDDRNPGGTGPFILKPPSVRYDLIFPDNRSFANENPSGNQEWEQFKLSTDTSDPQVDHHTTSIPAGTYRLRVTGVDMQNLNALLLPGRVLCVEEDGTPCTPLRPFLVGDTVFLDRDRDGVQDGGDPGLAGVTLELLDASGAVIATTGTGAGGSYSFPVESEIYTVRVADSNFAPGGPLEGYISTTGNSRTEVIVDDNILTYDFGYSGARSLGDRVWLDADADGVQDPEENGIADIVVQLLDGISNVLDQTTTDSNGEYGFSHLVGGTYTVRIDPLTLPEELIPTADPDGIATPHEAVATLKPDDDRDDVDFGYRGSASAGDRVWYDIDGDGVQDAGESGLAGVTMQLVDGNGNVLATRVTSADGIYSFANLLAGTYTVRVAASTLPGEGAPTYDLDGTATADSAAVTLTSGQARTDVDFGYRGTAALGDRVWYDIDGNGVQDAGEVGLNGVTVELLDGAGNVLLAAATLGNGGYTFAGLFPGTYSVRVISAMLPGGAIATYDLDGTGTPHLATAAVASGQNLATVDFGYRGNATVGDRVWLDLSGNGIHDSAEPGLNGVALELLDGAGNVLASNSTTASGIYGFANLLAGAYTVRVVSATLPPGLVQTYDLDGTGTSHSATLSLASAQSRTDADFGYRGTLQFGDRVWFDYDANGIQDSGEPGIPSATIELRDSSGTLVATTITGANGLYSFYNLPSSMYTVTVVASTLPGGGAVPTYDLDGAATPGTTGVTLTSGQSRTDVDFGYRGTASLGDRVWLDYDADGVQDAGETGLNGVTVQLLDSAGNVIASVVTAGDGAYAFPNLLTGTHQVRIVSSLLPGGAIQTYDLDSTGTAHVATAAVGGGQNRTDADFGYRLPSPGTGTIGYWKNHPQAWPVSSITIGGVVYTRDQAIVLLGTPSRGDKSIDLFKQLVAVKLSVLVGNNPACIYQTIASADAWMAAHPPGSNIGSSSAAWIQASAWHSLLDSYNNGQLCAPHRG